jgi:hypothetical protein
MDSSKKLPAISNYDDINNIFNERK